MEIDYFEFLHPTIFKKMKRDQSFSFRIRILLFLLIFGTGCSKDYTSVDSVITGTFYDSRNLEAIEGVILRVAEYYPIPKKNEFETQQYNLVQVLGTSTTNQDGYYNIPFSAVNNGDIYLIEYEIDGRYSSAPSVPVGIAEILSRNIEIEKLGGTITKDFDFNRYYYLKFRVVVHDNPFPPININGYWYHQNGMRIVATNPIYNTNNDTTKYIQVANNHTNYLQFMVTNDNNDILKNNPDIPVEINSDIDTIDYPEIIELVPSQFEFYMKN